MKHLTLPRFWRHYQSLPEEVQKLADKNFQLLKTNPSHSSLHFKKIRSLQSIVVRACWQAVSGVGAREAGRHRVVLDWFA